MGAILFGEAITVIEYVYNEHNGIRYHKFRSDQLAAALACIGDRRLKLVGQPKIAVNLGSYKFGSEIQISVTAPAGSVVEEPRVGSNDWDTIEINLTMEEALALIKKLQSFLDNNEQVV